MIPGFSVVNAFAPGVEPTDSELQDLYRGRYRAKEQVYDLETLPPPATKEQNGLRLEMLSAEELHDDAMRQHFCAVSCGAVVVSTRHCFKSSSGKYLSPLSRA